MMKLMQLFRNIFFHRMMIRMIAIAVTGITFHSTTSTAQIYTSCVIGAVSTACVLNVPSPLVLTHPSGDVTFGSESYLAVECINDVPISLNACECSIVVEPGVAVDDSDFCNRCTLSSISETSIAVVWDCSNLLVGNCVALAADLSCISNTDDSTPSPTEIENDPTPSPTELQLVEDDPTPSPVDSSTSNDNNEPSSPSTPTNIKPVFVSSPISSPNKVPAISPSSIPGSDALRGNTSGSMKHINMMEHFGVVNSTMIFIMTMVMHIVITSLI
jgi:hypothetical protein